MIIETWVSAAELVFKLQEANRKGDPGQDAPAEAGGGGTATHPRGELGRQQLFLGTVDNQAVEMVLLIRKAAFLGCVYFCETTQGLSLFIVTCPGP